MSGYVIKDITSTRHDFVTSICPTTLTADSWGPRGRAYVFSAAEGVAALATLIARFYWSSPDRFILLETL